MRTVTIAELKDKLSAYLKLVQAGEEVIVRNRNTPVAQLLPVRETAGGWEAHLVATGQMKLPEQAFNVEEILELRKGVRGKGITRKVLDDVLAWDREETDYASLLGQQRPDASVHPGAKKRQRGESLPHVPSRPVVGSQSGSKKRAGTAAPRRTPR